MRVLVLHAHPDAQSFSHALRARVERGLSAAKHEMRVRDLYAQNFEPRLSLSEKRLHLEPPQTKPQLAEHFADLLWCEAIVFVYPTWWGGQPAVLKGWFDRVLACGVAWELPDGAKRLKPTLHNVKKLVGVTTYGSPWYVNALQGVPGRRVITRALRIICHPFCRTTWLALYSMDASTDTQRAKFLRRVERRLSRL